MMNCCCFVRRLLPILLCLLLLSAAFPAYAFDELPQQAEEPGPAAAQVRNEKLDAAFEAGSLKLIETESWKTKPDASDFEMTEGLKSFMNEASGEAWETGLLSVLENYEFRILSKSPAGNSGIVSADGFAPLGLYNGKYHVLYPCASKSVADEYANLEKYYKLCSMDIRQIIGSEGVIYSPDGKYAAIYNTRYTLNLNQLFMDPILIDLSTGEMFLTATYPNKPFREDGAGAVTTAVFSSDGRYFYYVLFGHFENGFVRLYRYDLNSGETELCFETDKRIYYPCMSELPDGRLLFLEDTFDKSDCESVAVTGCSNGEWTLNEYPLKLNSTSYYVRMIHHSSNSGYACLLGGDRSGMTPIIQVIDPENGFEGLDRLILLAKDKDEIVTLSPEAYQQYIDSDKNIKQGIAEASYVFPYQIILHAVLSPDGHYLLLNALNNSIEKGRSHNLYLLRLDDLSVRKVEGLDADKILYGPLGKSYAINIEWNTDELIIGTEDGIKTYTFE